MEKIKNSKMMVFLLAALILLVGAGALIAAVHFTQSAELNKTVYEPAETVAPADAEPVGFSDKEKETPAAPTTAPTPAPEYVTGQQAVDSCVWTASNIFKMNIDAKALTAEYVPAEESDHSHNQWKIEDPGFTCDIDAATGDVISFRLPENAYNDEALTLSGYESKYETTEEDNLKKYNNDPDNIYLSMVKNIVESNLADGRSIEKTEVFDYSFFAVRDGNERNFGPDTKGTLLVGCKVFMGSGYCYTMLFLGVDNPTLYYYSVYPDKLALSSGSYYTSIGMDANDQGPEFITGGEARNACIKTASELFGMDVDVSALSVRFNPKQEHKDQNGKLMYTTHDNWSVTSFGFGCGIDAVSGDVISFAVNNVDYPGSSITLDDFDSGRKYGTDIRDKGPNMYKNKARELVEKYLADGRKISEIMIDGVQFVWDDNSAGFDPNATGTIQVDCYVFMNSGTCYTLSFWGTDEPVLKIFSSFPNKNACLNGYYYEEDAVDYPTDGEWQTAPGIIPGPSATPGS